MKPRSRMLAAVLAAAGMASAGCQAGERPGAAAAENEAEAAVAQSRSSEAGSKTPLSCDGAEADTYARKLDAGGGIVPTDQGHMLIAPANALSAPTEVTLETFAGELKFRVRVDQAAVTDTLTLIANLETCRGIPNLAKRLEAGRKEANGKFTPHHAAGKRTRGVVGHVDPTQLDLLVAVKIPPGQIVTFKEAEEPPFTGGFIIIGN